MELSAVRQIRFDSNGFCVLKHGDLIKCSKAVQDLIDRLGVESARAQGLKQPVTSYISACELNHTIYMLSDETSAKIIGFAKIGNKVLFIWDKFGEQREICPLCLLDFFIFPDFQRHGYGKRIYDYVLACEEIEPRKIAIDRPSPLSLAFMKKHYGLQNYVPQGNHFVVYDEYWDETTSKGSKTPMKNPKGSVTIPPQSRTPTKKPKFNIITWEQLD